MLHLGVIFTPTGCSKAFSSSALLRLQKTRHGLITPHKMSTLQSLSSPKQNKIRHLAIILPQEIQHLHLTHWIHCLLTKLKLQTLPHSINREPMTGHSTSSNRRKVCRKSWSRPSASCPTTCPSSASCAVGGSTAKAARAARALPPCSCA